MNYINTNTVIVAAEGVPQQYGKRAQSSQYTDTKTIINIRYDFCFLSKSH